MKKIFLFLNALCLAACVNPPKGLEKDAFTIQSLRDIDQDHYRCKCKKVRLGGKVLAATALKNQTKVEVLSLPVASYSAKPVIDSQSDGRFIAYLPGFVDPEALKNEYITVLGVLSGKESGKIDQANYEYPVIQVNAYKQWQQRQEYYYDDYMDDYWDGRFGWGRPYIWGRWGYPEPKRRTVLY
ncbi:outer membrane lipoprotein [Pasteurella langaaensis DSM 22999]|uniref:Outer membrane lipoprotein n=1 Tax=Alitibacter langaaensis DSM 22999 TaxID=1122935 RepID=A0A2U0TGZ8_9PAST|nr:Slp family lipoprotein [Pasteurella langaaensis]PVX42896.1 outer membrane lipoprotein [Pasteurella langaaensis DSM 22999]